MVAPSISNDEINYRLNITDWDVSETGCIATYNDDNILLEEEYDSLSKSGSYSNSS